MPKFNKPNPGEWRCLLCNVEGDGGEDGWARHWAMDHPVRHG